jgi:hypothetical protein
MLPGTDIEHPLPDPIDEIIGFNIDHEESCRICGCTQWDPCLTDEGPCFRVETGLCSRCARLIKDNRDPDT